MKKFITKHPLVFSGVTALLLITASVWGLRLGLKQSARTMENMPQTLQAPAVQMAPAETTGASEENYTQYARFDWSSNPLQLPALTQEERVRCTDLLARYAKGERPETSVPDDPAKTGFAVVPLAPEEYEGLSWYVFLPMRALSDEELLQLIDCFSQDGNTFDPSSLNESNCMRGGCVEVNRARTAEEGERLAALEVRYTHEGLRPSGALGADTASGGIVTVALNEDAHAGLNSFTFYPLRRLTDEELLEFIDQNMRNSLYNREGFAADWENDEAKCRAIARALFDMEESAVLKNEGYLPGDAVRPDTYMAHFEATQRDGKKRWYVVHIDVLTGTLYNAAAEPTGGGPQPTAAPGLSTSGVPAAEATSFPEPNLNDPKWADAAKAFAVKCSLASGNQIVSVRAYEAYNYNAGAAVSVALGLNDGASITLGVQQENMQIHSMTYYKEGFDVDAYLKSIG